MMLLKLKRAFFALIVVVMFFIAVNFSVAASDPVIIKDIHPGGNNSLPMNFASFNNNLFFRASDGVNGFQLWKSDGTASGTAMVYKINNPSGLSLPKYLTKVGNTLFFTADNNTNGRELWKSDGTASGTAMVKDIHSGGDDSTPYALTDFNNTLFFTADDGVNGTQLWKSDGTTFGTVMVKNISPGNVDNLTVANGLLFFTANDGVHGRELWKSDGTASNTVMVKDINLDNAQLDTCPYNLINVNGLLYFTIDDGVHGLELWKSDGTASNTVMVKDINPSSDTEFGDFSSINDTLYFIANDGINGRKLWKSNGTESGTVMVKSDMSAYYLAYLIKANNILYFITGNELWKSDGTASGTVMVKNINLTGNANIQNLTSVNGTVCFTANDGVHGNEPWVSNGSTNGTVMAKDINPGINSSYPDQFTDVNGSLYFTADDGVHGIEPWILNIKPTASSISPVSLTSSVVATTTVSSSFNKDVTLYVDYSLDNGSVWSPSSIGGVTASGNIATSTGLISGISTAIDNTMDFSWNSRADGVTSVAKAKLRLTPYDGVYYGSALISSSSILTTAQTEPGNSGIATSSSSTPQIVIIDQTQPVTLKIMSGVTNPTIDFSSMVTNGVGILPQVSLESSNANVLLQASTTVTSNVSSWDGIVNAPTATTINMPLISGQSRSLSAAIEVGSTDVKLTFDKAVRILLPLQAGKKAGYARSGESFTEITNICASDDETTGNGLLANSECKIDVGPDLVIWTKHFTTFAAYTQTTNNSGGSVAGSGGCSAVTYSPWQTCVNGQQFRNILTKSPDNCTPTVSQQLESSRKCLAEISPIMNTEKIENSKNTAATTLNQSSKTVFVFNSNLKSGMLSADVKELQKFLNTNNFLITKIGNGSLGKETSYFGTATKSALIKFQKANKISPASGLFGPLTRKFINSK